MCAKLRDSRHIIQTVTNLLFILVVGPVYERGNERRDSRQREKRSTYLMSGIHEKSSYSFRGDSYDQRRDDSYSLDQSGSFHEVFVDAHLVFFHGHVVLGSFLCHGDDPISNGYG